MCREHPAAEDTAKARARPAAASRVRSRDDSSLPRWLAFSALLVAVAALLAFDRQNQIPSISSITARVQGAELRDEEPAPDTPKPEPSEVWLPPTPKDIGDTQYLAQRPVPDLRLVLDEAEEQVLADTLQTIMSQYYLLRKDRIWMRATLFEGERQWRVRARLHGDSMTHWATSVRSWRVRFKAEDLFHGMREVVFIVPTDRLLSIDALCFHEGRTLGLLTLRDGFARMAVGEQPAAVYYMTEHVSREFLGISGRPETGVYVNRDFLFEASAAKLPPNMIADAYTAPAMKNHLKPGPREAAYRAALDRYFAVRTLEQFEAVADVEKFLKYQAIAMVHGSNHGRAYWNLKLFYDDSLGRFEPVPWDMTLVRREPVASARAPDIGLRGDGPKEHDHLIIQNSRLQFERNRYLWQLVRPAEPNILTSYDALSENLFEATARGTHPLQRAQRWREVAGRQRAILKSNVRALEEALARNDLTATFETSAARDSRDYIRLALVNRAASPAAIEEIRLQAPGRSAATVWPVLVDWNGDGRAGAPDGKIGSFEAQENARDLLVFRPDPPYVIFSERARSGELRSGSVNLLIERDGLAAEPTDVEIDFRNLVTGEPAVAQAARIERAMPPANPRRPVVRSPRVQRKLRDTPITPPRPSPGVEDAPSKH